MSGAEVLAMLRDHIAHRYGTQAEAARMWGVSSSFVSMILHGKKFPTERMLTELGIERVITITYRKTNE